MTKSVEVKSEGEKVNGKFLDEGNMISEYLLLMISSIISPFLFLLLICHVFNYKKAKKSCDGIYKHYTNITRLMFLLFGLFVLSFVYKLSIVNDIIIVTSIFSLFLYIFIKTIRGMRNLARHELPGEN